MEQATLDAFADELEKIAGKVTAYIFKDPMSYTGRSKVRGSVRKGVGAMEGTVGKGKNIGTGVGAALGAVGGGAAGYFGGGKKALPGILGALAGGAAGGLGGRSVGGLLARGAGTRKLKGHGVTAVRINDSPELQKVLRPMLQRKGLDVIVQGKSSYGGKSLAGLEQKILSRVGYPDPHVLKSLGLPTLK